MGYLIVGVIIGPHAIGLVSDLEFVEAAATIGVALLMLTVGMEVSVSQLKQVGKVGIWGGIAQILVTFALGLAVGKALFNWPLSQATLFGLAISLSSTMVGFKMLMDRGELDSMHGRIMVAILILQDIAVVLMMMVIPLLGDTEQNLALALATAAGKAIIFVGVAVASGAWLLPWLMGRVGGIRSRELFLLTVLALCLGTALGTHVLGLSAVFGAFVIGLVLRETKFAHQALAEITPLRDIFAALFFVSLGMLLDPMFVANNVWLILATVALIVSIKFLVVCGLVLFSGYGGSVAFLASAGLFQIGEFSFILGAGGVDVGILSDNGYSLIIASAIITMLLTPLSMNMASHLYPTLAMAPRERWPHTREKAPSSVFEPVEAKNRVIIAGFGRVGRTIGKGLQISNIPYTVIEIDPEVVSELRNSGIACIYGDASNFHVLSQIALTQATVLAVTFPDPLAVLVTAKSALTINPTIRIVARVHRASEAEALKKLGVVDLISPEFEASLEFLVKISEFLGWEEADIKHALAAARQSMQSPTSMMVDDSQQS